MNKAQKVILPSSKMVKMCLVTVHDEVKYLSKRKKGRFVELGQRSERFATHIIALTTKHLEE